MKWILLGSYKSFKCLLWLWALFQLQVDTDPHESQSTDVISVPWLCTLVKLCQQIKLDHNNSMNAVNIAL